MSRMEDTIPGRRRAVGWHPPRSSGRSRTKSGWNNKFGLSVRLP
jgi:hypothetical protein